MNCGTISRHARWWKNTEVAMNHSMYGADYRTHLKIIVVGLLCASLVAVVGIFGRIGSVDLGTASLVKANRSTVVTGYLPSIR